MKRRIDGYFPIIFFQNETRTAMGGVQMIGKEILYKDERLRVKRFNISEI